MRRECTIIGLGHSTDSHALGDTTSVRNIWLHHIDNPRFEVWSEVVPRVESFSKRNGDATVLELCELGDVGCEKWFLNEERSIGRKELDELLGHWAMYSAVEVKTDVKANALSELQPFDR